MEYRTYARCWDFKLETEEKTKQVFAQQKVQKRKRDASLRGKRRQMERNGSAYIPANFFFLDSHIVKFYVHEQKLDATIENKQDKVLCGRVCSQVLFCLLAPSPIPRPFAERLFWINVVHWEEQLCLIIYSYDDYISFEPILWSNSLVMRFDFFGTHTHTFTYKQIHFILILLAVVVFVRLLLVCRFFSTFFFFLV